MSNDHIGNRFSNNFVSLQLQLKTLLEECGGDSLMPFLDTLTNLNRSEQELVLRVMTAAIQKISNSPTRLETEGDTALKAFENDLYQDLMSAIQAEIGFMPRRKIEVISGGKSQPERTNSPIDLQAARKRKRGSSELIN